ncbi:NAD(P)/FAD-dependent oxidoreductase [Paenibacillus agricola]|uniref:FAD-binding oxidoreductase n=1 Tax=Paenibacillus agricola TaxID=2716264 RepID=A0ABX0JCV1_9BACL|nr:FAD-dependent oxidoreductase [Paenibacillus agricola]NHN32049.1 FAD-binding oxidoreductase [Paenibacillus agricola]
MEGIESQKLHHGSLYWPTTLPPSQIPSYPSLEGQITAEVAIIGGGITGALCAAVMARSGIKTVLVEGNRVASGSTAANTGLLQFSNDIMLNELAEKIGEAEAVRFYGECRKALVSLAQLDEDIPFETGFHVRSSLYCASTSSDVPKLFKEYSMLRKHGFPVEWGSPHNVGHHLPIRKPAALVTHGDAEINPVKFAHGLIAEAAQKGALIYEHTKVQEVKRVGEKFVITTDFGEIIANRVVRAVGYVPGVSNSTQLKPILKRSYALVTPANSLPDAWPYDCMMWETARPYFYFRTTPDGRLIAGGMDENQADPVTDTDYLVKRTQLLLAELRKLFPGNHWEAEHAWCGTFGESEDDLPFLGETPEQPGIFHALSCGGNGTVYGMIAAEMLRNRILGLDHPMDALLAPKRQIQNRETVLRSV